MWYAGKKPNYNKYRAQKIETPNGVFASKLEYQHFCELKLLENVGKIKGLRRQVRIRLNPKCTYIADFVYFDNENLSLVISDSKGVETRDFKVKKEWLLSQFKDFVFITHSKRAQRVENPYPTAQKSIYEELKNVL